MLPSAFIRPANITRPARSEGWSVGQLLGEKRTSDDCRFVLNSVALTLSNVRVVGDFGLTKGTLTINGTLQSNYGSQ